VLRYKLFSIFNRILKLKIHPAEYCYLLELQDNRPNVAASDNSGEQPTAYTPVAQSNKMDTAS
jgi:hypothetical protein